MTSEFLTLPTQVMQRLTADQAWHYRVLPHDVKEGVFFLYVEQGRELEELADELELVLGMPVRWTPVVKNLIDNTLQKYYLKKESRRQQQELSEEFVVNLIGEARSLKSSDIHLEIYEGQCRVRMRIDGQLVERYVLRKNEYPSLVNKIKIMANLDIAEKRLPQDGRIFHKQKGDQFDIRVSTLPTLYGEKIVMRILGSDASHIDIGQLGFSQEELRAFTEGIRRPNGILLISGPTGSGKTTTLYATLKRLNLESRNILTIEDPIEYTLQGINQVQLKENIGLDFARALRTFLRQDPDVIMVGEIRDTDTAQMAVRAALTGHLVLSTIHTNSAWGTVSRLMDMGVPPYLLAGTLNTTAAQRLVRKLCTECRQKVPFSHELYPRHFKPFRQLGEHFMARGCAHCFHTGYKGRRAIYEVIPVDEEMAAMIREGKEDVTEALKTRGIRSLAENAFELFAAGETSLDEIYPLLFNF